MRKLTFSPQMKIVVLNVSSNQIQNIVAVEIKLFDRSLDTHTHTHTHRSRIYSNINFLEN